MNRTSVQITNVEILANSNPTVLVDFKIGNEKSFQIGFKHIIPDYNSVSYETLKKYCNENGIDFDELLETVLAESDALWIWFDYVHTIKNLKNQETK